jgi:hypothetical protein
MQTSTFNYEILDLGLVKYTNAISNPDKIVSLIEDVDRRFMAGEHGDVDTIVAAWNPWTYNELLFNYQKFFPEVKDIPANDPYAKEMIEIADVLYSSLNAALTHYSNELYPFAAKNIKARENTIHLLKYGNGGHLPAHQDQGISSRVLSSVMYLNDNYDGGEIEFKNSGVKIKPEAGSIIFFPSNFLYVHEVYPITRGFRYSMPHWFHNMKEPIFSNGDE